MKARQSAGSPSSDTVETLILDLLDWMGPDPRPYAEVIEAWRTSCPRLPVWEDANDRRYITRHRALGRGTLISLSAAGAEHLHKYANRGALRGVEDEDLHLDDYHDTPRMLE